MPLPCWYPTSPNLEPGLSLKAVLYMLVIFVVAAVMPNLSVVFSLTGGTSVVCIVFLFPLGFYIASKDLVAEPPLLNDAENGTKDALLAADASNLCSTADLDEKAHGWSPCAASFISWTYVIVTPILGLWATGATIASLIK